MSEYMLKFENKEAWYALLLAVVNNLSVDQSTLIMGRGGYRTVDRHILAEASYGKSLRRAAMDLHCSASTIARARAKFRTLSTYEQMSLF